MLEKFTVMNIGRALLVKQNKENYKYKKSMGENTNDEDSEELSCDSELEKYDNAILIVFLIILLLLWAWAITALIQHWQNLVEWAKVFALLALVNPYIGGPAASLIIIYVSLPQKSNT